MARRKRRGFYTATVSTVITDNQKQQILQLSKRTGQSISKILRIAITDLFKKYNMEAED